MRDEAITFHYRNGATDVVFGGFDDRVNNYVITGSPVPYSGFAYIDRIEGPLDTIMFINSKLSTYELKLFTYSGDVNVYVNSHAVKVNKNIDYCFANSKYNKPVDRWDMGYIDSAMLCFYKSEYNHPLNNWRLHANDTDDITAHGMFYRSKFNHPLDKWFTDPTLISACMMFTRSEFHQDISMWNIHPKSQCQGMFYNSKYTIAEVKDWHWVKNLEIPVDDLFDKKAIPKEMFSELVHSMNNMRSELFYTHIRLKELENER